MAGTMSEKLMEALEAIGLIKTHISKEEQEQASGRLTKEPGRVTNSGNRSVRKSLEELQKEK